MKRELWITLEEAQALLGALSTEACTSAGFAAHHNHHEAMRRSEVCWALFERVSKMHFTTSRDVLGVEGPEAGDVSYRCPACISRTYDIKPDMVRVGLAWDHRGSRREIVNVPHGARCAGDNCLGRAVRVAMDGGAK